MPAVVTDSRSNVQSDPLRNFRFQVNINHTTPRGSRLVQLGFMTCDGLNLETQVVAYREGGMNATALPLTAPILTTRGWIKMGEVAIGERMIDPRGQDSRVVGIYPAGVKDTYRVTLADGSSADACYGHWWEVEVRDTNFRRKNTPDIRHVTTLELKQLVEKRGTRVLLPRMVPFGYDPEPELPLDPYLLGVLLAEGSFADTVTLAGVDEEVLDRVRPALPPGHELLPRSNGTSMCKWAISVGNYAPGVRNRPGRNQVMAAVRELGLLGHRAWEKFIPEVYLRASVQDRLDLLRGLMDGDGSIDARTGNVRFASTSEDLTHGVQELIASLGGRCRVIQETDRSYVYRGIRVAARDVWWIQGMSGLKFNPFHLSRKAQHYRFSAKADAQMRRVRSVDFVGRNEVQCIEVSADSHLFVTKDCIPTKNTQKMPGQSDFTPLTLSSGKAPNKPQLWEWIEEIFSVVQGQGQQAPGGNFRTDVDIFVLQHPYTASNRVPIPLKYKVFNAWPSS